MPAFLESNHFWLGVLNVVLAVIVLVPLLFLGAVVVREVMTRFRKRRHNVRWSYLPGVGRIPVLKESRRSHARRRIGSAGGQGRGS